MITSVRRCDHAKCGQDIREGADYYALLVAVASLRNERMPSGLITPADPDELSRVEVCSPACVTAYVQGLVDAVACGRGVRVGDST